MRERDVRGGLPHYLSFPMIGVHSGWSDLNRDGKFYQESCNNFQLDQELTRSDDTDLVVGATCFKITRNGM